MAQIKDDKQYKAMMARIDELFFDTDENTPADDPRLLELDVLSALVEEYEQEHHPIEVPSLSETMSARLAENHWSQKEMASLAPSFHTPKPWSYKRHRYPGQYNKTLPGRLPMPS